MKFSYPTGILDIPFIRQWQITLIIFNAIAICLNVLMIMVESARENLDWTLPLIGTLSMAIIVNNLFQRYVGEFVDLSKI